MIRVNVIVEGPTEESFIKNILAVEFWPREIFLVPVILGPPGRKGGRVTYDRLKRDACLHLKQDPNVYCSTMVDLYGLGADFPGDEPSARISGFQRAIRIEGAMRDDVLAQEPASRADVRFIPYIQVHEYEALLFSDPDAFASSLGKPRLSETLRAVLESVSGPEEINNGPNTAPSKRIIGAYPGYKKIIEGTIGASAVGVPRMRAACPHFDSWIQRLESLTPLS